VNWELLREDFAWDGSLRDIYVFETTLADWQKTLDLIRTGPYRAELQPSIESDSRWRIEALMAAEPRPLLRFSVGEVDRACHFFDWGQIESGLDPRQIGEPRAELQFLSSGTLVGSYAQMTSKGAQ